MSKLKVLLKGFFQQQWQELSTKCLYFTYCSMCLVPMQILYRMISFTGAKHSIIQGSKQK